MPVLQTGQSPPFERFHFDDGRRKPTRFSLGNQVSREEFAVAVCMTLNHCEFKDRSIPWKEPNDEKICTSPDNSAYNNHTERSGQNLLGPRGRSASRHSFRCGNDGENTEALRHLCRRQSTYEAVCGIATWCIPRRHRINHGRILRAIQDETAGKPVVVGTNRRANRNAYRTRNKKQPDSLKRLPIISIQSMAHS